MALQSQGKSSIGGNPVGEGVMLHTQRKSLVVGNAVNGILVSLIIVVTVGMKYISMIEVIMEVMMVIVVVEAVNRACEFMTILIAHTRIQSLSLHSI